MNGLDYSEALTAENNLPPGPYELKCYLQAPLTKDEIAILREDIVNSGINLISIKQSGAILSIRAVKEAAVATDGGISFLPALVLTPFVAAVALLAGLAILAYTVHELPRVLDAAVPVIVISIIGLVLFNVTRPGGRYGAKS